MDELEEAVIDFLNDCDSGSYNRNTHLNYLCKLTNHKILKYGNTCFCREKRVEYKDKI